MVSASWLKNIQKESCKLTLVIKIASTSWQTPWKSECQLKDLIVTSLSASKFWSLESFHEITISWHFNWEEEKNSWPDWCSIYNIASRFISFNVTAMYLLLAMHILFYKNRLLSKLNENAQFDVKKVQIFLIHIFISLIVSTVVFRKFRDKIFKYLNKIMFSDWFYSNFWVPTIKLWITLLDIMSLSNFHYGATKLFSHWGFLNNNQLFKTFMISLHKSKIFCYNRINLDCNVHLCWINKNLLIDYNRLYWLWFQKNISMFSQIDSCFWLNKRFIRKLQSWDFFWLRNSLNVFGFNFFPSYLLTSLSPSYV